VDAKKSFTDLQGKMNQLIEVSKRLKEQVLASQQEQQKQTSVGSADKAKLSQLETENKSLATKVQTLVRSRHQTTTN